jgi:hypothetical protein
MVDKRDRRISYEIMLLTKELSQSEAWQTHVQLMRLETSRQVHLLNRGDLLDGLAALRPVDVLPTALGEIAPPMVEVATIHVLRLLHNYLASAVTLADHLGRFAEEMYSHSQRTVFLREYNERWCGLPVFTFTRRLRVYSLHLRIPLSIAQLEYNGNGYDVAVLLDGAELRAWDGWKAKGRVFLGQLSDDVRLEDIVIPHERAVEDFFDWLTTWHITDVFKRAAIELAEFERRRQAIVDASAGT